LLVFLLNNIKFLKQQYTDYNLTVDEKNSLANQNVVRSDNVFFLKNLYLAKESEIIYLQNVVKSYLNFEVDVICAEYYDIEEGIVQNSMDNGLVGLRNEVARHTRMLNLEERKSVVSAQKIEELVSEIEYYKNPLAIKQEKLNQEKEKNEANITPSTLTPQNLTTTSTPNTNNMNKKMVKPKKAEEKRK